MKTDCMERGGGCRIPPLPDLVLVAPLFSRIPPPPAECSSSSSSTALAPVEHCKWIDSGQQQQQPRLSSPPPPPPPQLARPPGDLEDLGSTKGIETSPPLSSHYIHLFSFRHTTLLRTNRALGIEEVFFFSLLSCAVGNGPFFCRSKSVSQSFRAFKSPSAMPREPPHTMHRELLYATPHGTLPQTQQHDYCAQVTIGKHSHVAMM